MNLKSDTPIFDNVSLFILALISETYLNIGTRVTMLIKAVHFSFAGRGELLRASLNTTA
jgi:hypothetical protein